MQALLRRAEQEGKDEAKRQADRRLITDGTIGTSDKTISQRPVSPKPRKIFVGSRSSEPLLNAYLDDWYKYLETFGKAHYPEQAKRQKLHGTVQATIEIDTKGNLGSVEVNRSSGHAILDEALINIVKRAAPFKPLPPEISQKVDIVSITRTWTFTTTEALQKKADSSADQ